MLEPGCPKDGVCTFYFLVDLVIADACALFRESHDHLSKTKTRKDRERTKLKFGMALVKQMVQKLSTSWIEKEPGSQKSWFALANEDTNEKKVQELYNKFNPLPILLEM